MEVDVRPRKRLKIVEPLLVSLVVWGLYCAFFPAISCDHGRARDGTTSHLIGQLDQAVESFETDSGFYPSGDGWDSKEMVRALQQRGRKGRAYFEFSADLLNGGSVVNPSTADSGGIIHYRHPGVHRPSGFDLWAEDSRGNAAGINNG